MITVGLDFGTHQTKICVEYKEGIEINYSFMQFEDCSHNSHYTLPSIIGINNDGYLTYGYLPDDFEGRIIKYFKQSTFRPETDFDFQIDAMNYSTWYLAYIIFDLEEKYGQQFAIQMGVPTDSDEIHIHIAKVLATRIIITAYQLVEDIFKNDKQKFLSTPLEELEEITELVPYSDRIKQEYGLLIFPEAYACLKPLISQGKLATGMSIMVDIGGGTTDISFFTIENKKPQVYDFYSINKGLNYLTRVDENNNRKEKVNVLNESEIDGVRRNIFISDVNQVCSTLRTKLEREFKNQTSLNIDKLHTALKNRPLVYCGGGSTFGSLRVSYGGYRDTKQISYKEWDIQSISEIDDIIAKDLCPILSTAYGLAISTETDEITTKPFRDIFINIRGAEEDEERNMTNVKTSNSYKDDWMNKDYGSYSYRSGGSIVSKKRKYSDSSVSIKFTKPQININQPKTEPKNEMPFYNLPFTDIVRKSLVAHEVTFNLQNGTKVSHTFYGKVRTINGYAFDLYYDDKKNMVLDKVGYNDGNWNRNTLIAVDSKQPLFSLLEKHGIECLQFVTEPKKKKKKHSKALRLTLKIIDPESEDYRYYNFMLVSKSYYEIVTHKK